MSSLDLSTTVQTSYKNLQSRTHPIAVEEILLTEGAL